MPSPRDPESTLYLIDGTSNLFRAFHAIHGLSTRKGLPTNAVYGFTTMLRRLLKERAPRRLAVAFDLGEPTFRHAAYAEYKANRPEPPEGLLVQVPYVKRVCRVLGVPILELAGFEADDLIATMTARARAAGFEVVVVANDKDLLQLVREGVLVYHPVREEYLDAEGVERIFGVPPERVRDVLALCGDASDNIPGVDGIGEKGAKELVRRFGDLEAVLQAAPTVERKSYREGLLTQADRARLSLDLATLRFDAPIPFDPEALRLLSPDGQAAVALFRELEFETLAKEFEGLPPPPSGEGGAPAPVEGGALAPDVETVERVAESLRRAPRIALNLERDRAAAMRADLVGVTLAGGAGESFYIPLGHALLGARGPLDAGAALRILRPLLEGARPERIGHNVKPDLILLRRLGLDPAPYRFDTMIAGYLLDPSRESQDLARLAREIAGLDLPRYETLLGSGARGVPLSEVAPERAAPVLGARVAGILAIQERLRSALASNGLLPLFEDLEMPLVEVLASMEQAGVGVDVSFLRTLSASWQGDLERLTAEIHAAAGREFNIQSPRQLGEVLFETLGLKPGRRTRKTRSFSTGVEVLEELAGSHPLPRLVLEFRELSKLKSTYVDALPDLVHPATGRVHTSFNQTVAATGRLSSSDPNLQNIPIRTERGRQIRRAFVPERGYVLLSADYSQIELRILAHLCGDEALVAAFREGEDVHRRTAAEIFGVLPGLVSDEMRRRAKAVNFGVLYGMGPQRLARDQGISLKDAAAFIERYFHRFPRVKAYIDSTIAAAEAEGRVHTLFHRVRHLPELKGSDRNARQQAIRAAVNTTIQGTAADLIKMAMVTLFRRLHGPEAGARMILQVHDELVLEVPEDSLESAADLAREVMETVHPLAVPLLVDLRAGVNWLDMRPLARSKD
jgi:DNA polymerase-1